MKPVLPATVLTLVAVTFAALFHVAAIAFAKSQERREVHTYLSDALAPPNPPQETVSWEASTRALVRPFTEVDAQRVGLAVSLAWRAHAAAMDGGEMGALEDYFSGVALGRARASSAAARADGTGMTVLTQVARPTMYHLDGSVLAIETQSLTARFATENDRLVHHEITLDDTVSVLMNETTGWRVFAHELRAFQPLASKRAVPAPRGPLAGLNYYPAQTPWTAFWPNFDEDVVEADLDRISDLGANAVRFFLPYADFANPENASLHLPRLEQFLRLAEARDLTVIPTLFDMMPSFNTATWPDHVLYLQRVLPVLAASPAVGLLDVKNEPDLDYNAHGTALIQAWLRTMIALSREEAPRLALTVGWSSAERAGDLADVLDIISYHDYAAPEGVDARLAQVREWANGKPVYVTEIGQSSWELALDFPSSLTKQADVLAQRLEALSEADGVFVWTLNDFERVDVAAIGGSPWAQRLQASFGLHSIDGAPKPATYVVRKLFREFLDMPDT